MNSLEIVILVDSKEIPWSALEAPNTNMGKVFKYDWQFVHEFDIRDPTDYKPAQLARQHNLEIRQNRYRLK